MLLLSKEFKIVFIRFQFQMTDILFSDLKQPGRRIPRVIHSVKGSGTSESCLANLRKKKQLPDIRIHETSPRKRSGGNISSLSGFVNPSS
jgi:hypothetical protein